MAHEGGCLCGSLRYCMDRDPLIVHACHCRQCQRLSGSAFVLNAVIEKHMVRTLAGTPALFHFEGTQQTAAFCPECGTYVWSEYSKNFEPCWFVRVGTLDQPDLFPPDVHIYTGTKQPWLTLSSEVPRFNEFYELDELWPETSLQRFRACLDSG